MQPNSQETNNQSTGVMFCKKCGTQIPDNMNVCPSCAVTVEEIDQIAIAGNKVKSAAKDSWRAFKIFASNPVTDMSMAFESLGQVRALGVGITFGFAFAICNLFGVYALLHEYTPNEFTGFIKNIIVAIVPFVSLFGASVMARKVFRGEGGLGHDSFISGASLLPFGCIALLVGILGSGNFEVIAVLALFAVCLTILMLFTGLTRIYKLSERSATIAVPLMFIASAWLSKIMFTILFT